MLDYYVLSLSDAKQFLKEKGLVCKIWSRYPDYFEILEKYFPETRKMMPFYKSRYLMRHQRFVEEKAGELFSVIIKDAIDAAEELEKYLEEETGKEKVTVYVLEVYPYIETKAWRIKKKPRGRKGKPYYFVRRTTKIINIKNAGVVLAVDKEYKDLFFYKFPELLGKYARYRSV